MFAELKLKCTVYTPDAKILYGHIASDVVSSYSHFFLWEILHKLLFYYWIFMSCQVKNRFSRSWRIPTNIEVGITHFQQDLFLTKINTSKHGISLWNSPKIQSKL